MDESDWEPIGTYSARYSGVFDGGGHTISGLYINWSREDYVGLFGRIHGGTVRSLTVRTVEADTGAGEYGVTGSWPVGIIAGRIDNSSRIENCAAYGSISGVNTVGGIVGTADGWSDKFSKISGCVNNALVHGTGEDVGGIAGDLGHNNILENCTNNGAVSVDTNTMYSGGIVGYASIYTTIRNCVNTAPVHATNNVTGGIVGGCPLYVTIENCINIGNVSSDGDYVGAIVGYGNAQLSNSGYLKTGEINTNINAAGSGSVGGTTASDDAELMKSMIIALRADIDKSTIASNGEAHVTLLTSLGTDSFGGYGAVRNVDAQSSEPAAATASADNSGATVSGVAPGYTTITVTADFYPTHVENTITSGSLTLVETPTTVEYTYGVTVEEIISTGIIIGGGESEITVEEGESVQIEVELEPSDSTDGVTWESSDPNVAMVDENGVVTAVGPGTATITATTDSGISASITITVTASDTGDDGGDGDTGGTDGGSGSGSHRGGGGGGCNAGLPALALLTLIPFALRRKR